MALFVATFRFPGKGPTGEKVAGMCPLNGKRCTDIGGRHHSLVISGESLKEVVETAERVCKLHGVTLTRIEEA